MVLFAQTHEETGPRGSAAHLCCLGDGRRSIGGTAGQASPGSESNCRATQGMGKPFAASFVHPATGPLVEEAVRAQGHRGAAPYGVEEATRARGGRGLKDFAGDDEKRRSAPMRRPTPTPTSPMTRWREWPSGHNEGLPQPGIGRQPAHEMLGWQHFGKREVKEKGVWTLARRPDSSARCPNSKTRAVVSNSLQ